MCYFLLLPCLGWLLPLPLPAAVGLGAFVQRAGCPTIMHQCLPACLPTCLPAAACRLRGTVKRQTPSGDKVAIDATITGGWAQPYQLCTLYCYRMVASWSPHLVWEIGQMHVQWAAARRAGKEGRLSTYTRLSSSVGPPASWALPGQHRPCARCPLTLLRSPLLPFPPLPPCCRAAVSGSSTVTRTQKKFGDFYRPLAPGRYTVTITALNSTRSGASREGPLPTITKEVVVPSTGNGFNLTVVFS